MFWLVDFREQPRPPFWPTNGLIAVQPGAAVVFTGIHTGVVTAWVDPRSEPPAEVDMTGWHEVVEVSMQAPTGRVAVASPEAEPPDLPSLTTAGPGSYRVRVHARGRDTEVD